MMIQLDCRSSFYDALEALGEKGLRGRISFDEVKLHIYPQDEDAAEAIHSLLTDLDLLPTSGDHPNDDDGDHASDRASAGFGTDEDYERGSDYQQDLAGDVE